MLPAAWPQPGRSLPAYFGTRPKEGKVRKILVDGSLLQHYLGRAKWRDSKGRCAYVSVCVRERVCLYVCTYAQVSVCGWVAPIRPHRLALVRRPNVTFKF